MTLLADVPVCAVEEGEERTQDCWVVRMGGAELLAMKPASAESASDNATGPNKFAAFAE